MPTCRWTTDSEAQLAYNEANFAVAKAFFFARWCERALERHVAAPDDLSGSCKYGSLFMRCVFGGSLRGHFQHQYNLIDGQLVDLSHEARDVVRMCNPYLHEPEFFAIPELQASLVQCLARSQTWAQSFLATQA